VAEVLNGPRYWLMDSIAKDDSVAADQNLRRHREAQGGHRADR